MLTPEDQVIFCSHRHSLAMSFGDERDAHTMLVLTARVPRDEHKTRACIGISEAEWFDALADENADELKAQR